MALPASELVSQRPGGDRPRVEFSARTAAKAGNTARNCRFSLFLSPSAAERIPGTKKALNACIARHRCSTFRPKEHLHVFFAHCLQNEDYFFPEWYTENYAPLLTPVKCFKGDTQEPYVMVRKTTSLPRFDERFVNYGYNKVQWLEHLRFVGLRLRGSHQWIRGGHPTWTVGGGERVRGSSKYWSEFIYQLLYDKRPNRVVVMRSLYQKFKRELKANYTSKQKVRRCWGVCSI